MPPRKKAAAAAAPSAQPVEGQKLESFYLPKSTISKLAKRAVPEGTSLQKDVPSALQKGSVVFINYLTALAHEIASESGQKTITAAHITEAAKQLGWAETDALRKNLKSELNAFRKLTEAKKSGDAGPSKPRVPGGPVGRPRKAPPPDAAAPAPLAGAVSRSPSAVPAASVAVEPEEDEEEDETMTMLQDDRAPEMGEEDQQAYGTAEEEEDDDEMVEDDEEEDESEGEPEPEEEEGEEDRVGAGLEDDVEMGGGSDKE